jgi:hypothetical protein
MNILLKNLNFSKFSYISENMTIKTNFIAEIEKHTNIHVRFYYEKILISIYKSEILNLVFQNSKLKELMLIIIIHIFIIIKKYLNKKKWLIFIKY